MCGSWERGLWKFYPFLLIKPPAWGPRGGIVINFTIHIPFILEILQTQKSNNWQCSFSKRISFKCKIVKGYRRQTSRNQTSHKETERYMLIDNRFTFVSFPVMYWKRMFFRYWKKRTQKVIMNHNTKTSTEMEKTMWFACVYFMLSL